LYVYAGTLLSIKFKSSRLEAQSLRREARELHKVVNFVRLSGNRGKWKSQLVRILKSCAVIVLEVREKVTESERDGKSLPL
jgi:hypothetical protein